MAGRDDGEMSGGDPRLRPSSCGDGHVAILCAVQDSGGDGDPLEVPADIAARACSEIGDERIRAGFQRFAHVATHDLRVRGVHQRPAVGLREERQLPSESIRIR